MRYKPDWLEAQKRSEGLLVIWHRIQSSRSTPASTTAGRSLLADRSEKGKLTSTTEPSADPHAWVVWEPGLALAVSHRPPD
jgi:hypothetical protein